MVERWPHHTQDPRQKEEAGLRQPKAQWSDTQAGQEPRAARGPHPIQTRPQQAVGEGDPEGLEVRVGGAAGWSRVDQHALPAGALVVNIGDSMRRLSGGRYRSTPHRVRELPAASDRLALIFFFAARYDAPLTSVAAGVASRSGADDAALGDGIAAAGLISHNYLTANASERAVFDAWLSSLGPQGSGPRIGGE